MVALESSARQPPPSRDHRRGFIVWVGVAQSTVRPAVTDAGSAVRPRAVRRSRPGRVAARGRSSSPFARTGRAGSDRRAAAGWPAGGHVEHLVAADVDHGDADGPAQQQPHGGGPGLHAEVHIVGRRLAAADQVRRGDAADLRAFVQVLDRVTATGRVARDRPWRPGARAPPAPAARACWRE